MQPRAVAVQPLTGYRLAVTFDDGTSGVVDLTQLLYERDTGVFAALREPERFAQVTINPEWGHLEWPNGADIDPYVLYEEAHRRAVG
jgi:uncharacterized protein DUF2442